MVLLRIALKNTRRARRARAWPRNHVFTISKRMFEYIVRVVGPDSAKRHEIAQMYPRKQARGGKPHGNFASSELSDLFTSPGHVAQLLYFKFLVHLIHLIRLVRLVWEFPNWLVFWFTWSDNEVHLVRLVQFNGSFWKLTLLPSLT